ncbi:hypothetical protein HYH03_009945 [Edaphochlamys debaryana]|uniref:Prolyl endopeptidase-like n=1 Tax=Edaphochlamys debaryana TaxID=47281 RepID=A0A836BWR6_9CHLO|nr:hypothetical protein HYH03_009945 [Edaphochlamys debaryana]|eukprot:KAG2491785.1 hypothetical protein HYH03_009945 [Edaphochlamys debaryana]
MDDAPTTPSSSGQGAASSFEPSFGSSFGSHLASWLPSFGSSSASSPASASSPGPGWRLARHLAAEDRHTRRALGAGGVEALAGRLLREMRDRYMGDTTQHSVPEPLGAYAYWVARGPDGGLEAYLRAPVLRPAGGAPGPGRGPAGPHGAHGAAASSGGGGWGGPAAAEAGLDREEAFWAAAAAAAGGGGAPPPCPPGLQLGPMEVLLDRTAVEADVRVAEALTGLKLSPSIGAVKLCPSHRLLAYTLPLEGQHDAFVGLVRDTASGRLLLPGGVVPHLAGPTALELGGDGRSLLTVAPDEGGRPARVLLHDVSALRPPPPRPLLEEPDPAFFLGLGRTKDGALLLLSANSKTSSEVHVLDASDPWASPPRLVQPRAPGLEYFVEHQAWGEGGQEGGGEGRGVGGQEAGAEAEAEARSAAASGRLIILTNAPPLPASSAATSTSSASSEGSTAAGGSAGAPGPGPAQAQARGPAGELTLVWAPLGCPGRDHWRPLLRAEAEAARAEAGVVVTDMDVFGERVVLYERRGGLPAVSVLSLPRPPPPRSSADPGTEAGTPAPAGAGAEPPPAGDPVLLPLPPWALHLTPGFNADPHATALRLTAEGPLRAPATLDLPFPTLDATSPDSGAAAAAAAAAVTVSDAASARGSCGGGSGSAVAPLTLAEEAPPPAAAALAAACTLLRLEVPSPPPRRSPAYGSTAFDGLYDGVAPARVPVTLVLPPGLTWPPSPLAAAAADGSSAAAGVAPPLGGLRWQVLAAPSAAESSAAGSSSTNGCGERSWAGLEGPRPVLLQVYGAYGMPLELPYDPALLCLLGRGWAVGWVHVRGGGELGRRWHAAGSRSRKAASAADLAAAAAALAAAGLTAPGLVAGRAISAGGLALAPALAGAPSLWGAAVLRTAFLELLGPSVPTDPRVLPLAAHEWDEWGHPDREEEWAAIEALCPYRRLTDRAVAAGWRAAVLASCADEDPRVPPGGPAKWVARLRGALRTAGRGGDVTVHASPDRDPTPSASARGHPDEDRTVAAAVGSRRRSLTPPPPESARGNGSGGGGGGGRGGGGSAATRRSGSAAAPAAGFVDSSEEGYGTSGGAAVEAAAAWRREVAAPLLRVHADGTGHVREGDAAAEEAAEEAAFLLTAIPPPPPRPPPENLVCRV